MMKLGDEMYCVKCGVKLSDNQELCPICGTKVYHPDIKINIDIKKYKR